MVFTNRYSSLAGPDLRLTEYRFDIHSMERAVRNSCKILIAIQRSDQTLWTVRTVTLA